MNLAGISLATDRRTNNSAKSKGGWFANKFHKSQIRKFLTNIAKCSNSNLYKTQKSFKTTTVLGQSCAVFCRNLQIYDLQIILKICGLTPLKIFWICDSGMNQWICGFAICRLLKKVCKPTYGQVSPWNCVRRKCAQPGFTRARKCDREKSCFTVFYEACSKFYFISTNKKVA